MIRVWQGRYAQWLVSGGYWILLYIGNEAESVYAWRTVFTLITLLSFSAWQAALRRSRAITDTPTSTIAGAAQGYVELQGRGLPATEHPTLEPLKQTPCLWYRYKIEHRNGDTWETESAGESSDSFMIDDGSGLCMVEPDGAEVLTQTHDSWQREGRRYSLSLIVPNESLYVLGAFRTWNGDSATLDLHQDVAQLLRLWKEDMAALRNRFDLNHDGEIDLNEWEKVRIEAQREVEKRHREQRSTPEIHYIGMPENGRLFLLSSIPPAKIVRRFRLWALAHVTVFLAALYGCGYWWQQQP